MKAWLITLWNIALMRAGPQDLPTGRSSPVLAVVLFALVIAVSGLVDTREAGRVDLADSIVASIVVSIALPLILTASILAARGQSARFGQTAAALFGTGALIGLINIPLAFSSQTPAPAPLAVLALIGLFWSLAVDGHIWRSALDCAYAVGLVVAVVILFLQLFVFQAMANPGVS